MFVDIVLPLALDVLTYEVEAGSAIAEGQAVEVALGKSGKHYWGVVWKVHNDKPTYRTRQILNIGEQMLSTEQMWLWRWIAEYYMCTLGEVMRFAMPAQLKTGREAKQRKPKELKYASEFDLPVLSEAQNGALSSIGKNISLLYGITGSGKTEIYAHLFAEQFKAGRSVLYLVPEIAMSSQLVERMERVFGDRVVVHHSLLTPHARKNIYRRLQQSSGGEVVIGVRSAIFLPINNLGLIVVDDEHDDAYKQSDEQPRYNARDCAVVMARERNIPCLLASATPSIESYANALTGKYLFVSLTERYGKAELPEIEISDTMRSLVRGERRSHFNKELKDAIADTLERGEQVMLLQNRRGGQTEQGYGTEHLEEEVNQLFPTAKVARLDGEIMSSKVKYRDILKKFNKGEYNILVGTQVIAKGFDFEQVTLVGVLNADNLMLMPDFRNTERAFQLLTQMAGRAGRGGSRGRVIIQTSNSENPLFGWVKTGDYRSMALAQMAERKAFNYPPYGRLIEVTLRHADTEVLSAVSDLLYHTLRKTFGEAVTTPHPPVKEFVKGRLHSLSVLLRLPSSQSLRP